MGAESARDTSGATGKRAAGVSASSRWSVAGVPDIAEVLGRFSSASVATLRERFFGRPLASFHLVVTLAVLLTVFGLVMVLSASSVEGYAEDGSAYGKFTPQAVFAVLGAVLFYCALRMPVRYLRKLAGPAIIVSTILLALVLIPGVGTLSQGARRWFVVAGLSVQPSELAKLALCVWGAHLLASRRRTDASMKELLIPLLPVAFLICVLIMLEPNLSTTITIAIIVGALLWFAGLPVRVFMSFAVTGAALALILAMVEGYRSQRVLSFIGGIDDPQGAGYQAMQARYALANGGFWGVGLGQSRAKWSYLPNAHNDFIFAIIGEELGLIGGLLVVVLFAMVAYVGFRISRRSVDPFLRLVTATITVLLTAQALINIGYVVGLLPVTGIQLPLLSAGGTSTLTVLVMLGLLANAARHEPEAVAALTLTGEGRFGRLFRLPVPVAYVPSRTEVLRERLNRKRVRSQEGPGSLPRTVTSSARGYGARDRAGAWKGSVVGQSYPPARGSRSAGRARTGAGKPGDRRMPTHRPAGSGR